MGGNNIPGKYLYKGKIYEGMAAVSAASKVGIPTICYHLRTYGNLDKLGAGRGRLKRGAKPAKPVSFGGYHWRSMGDMAADLGMKYGNLWRWFKKGSTVSIMAAIVAAENKSELKRVQRDGRATQQSGKAANRDWPVDPTARERRGASIALGNHT